MYPEKIRVGLGSNADNYPFGLVLLLAWIHSDFQPKRCRKLVERLLEAVPEWQSVFRLEGFSDGGMVVTDEYLYPKPCTNHPLYFEVPVQPGSAVPSRNAKPGRTHPTVRMMKVLESHRIEVGRLLRILRKGAHWLDEKKFLNPDPGMRETYESYFGEKNAKLVAEFFRGASRIKSVSEFQEKSVQVFGRKIGKVLTSHAVTGDREWPSVQKPGIYRREHASIVVRSKTNSILVDPICLWRGYKNLWKSPLSEGNYDAICITHSHRDHWNAPSILYSAGNSKVPVIVPENPTPNFLAPWDMKQILSLLGQPVMAPKWWSSVVIGDITVDILPFYGEQPTATSPGAHPTIRNWGNCYRFNTPQFSVLVLVDSGVDPAGSMVDVVRESVKRRGPPDFLMTSLPMFLSPFWVGLCDSYLALPFSQMGDYFKILKQGKLQSTTPGPRGVTELMVASGAKNYLTYGNGFEDLGVEIIDVAGDGQPGERELLKKINNSLHAKKARGHAIMWNPGDVILAGADRRPKLIQCVQSNR